MRKCDSINFTARGSIAIWVIVIIALLASGSGGVYLWKVYRARVSTQQITPEQVIKLQAQLVEKYKSDINKKDKELAAAAARLRASEARYKILDAKIREIGQNVQNITPPKERKAICERLDRLGYRPDSGC
jgi:uncharacterized protein HemX